MFLEIIADALQIRCRGRRPAYAHLGAQHLFKPGVHFFFFDEFATVGVGFTREHSSAKTRVLIQQPQSGILQQFNRVALPGVLGELRQLRLLFGCKLDFHALKIREERPCGNDAANLLDYVRTATRFTHLEVKRASVHLNSATDM